MLKYLKILLPLMVFASCSNGPKDAGGKRYRTVIVGEQVWMAENLSTQYFRNGDPIQHARTPEEWNLLALERKPAWCIQKEGFGKLYNWFAVSDPRGLAPQGWHVATDDDWKELTDFLGGEVPAAFKIRTTGLDNEESGFNGLAAGLCNKDGEFHGLGSYGYWWTSTETTSDFAWIRQLNYAQCNINSLNFDKRSGLSVRCIKNN